jgi:uncharacterized membrane protein affecting hemolysin expression
MIKLDWEAIFKSRILWIAVGLVVLIVVVAFTIDRCDTWRENRGIAKDKKVIANLANEIANQSANINAMAANRDEKIGELHVLTDNLANASNADAQARAEADQAIANLEKARNSNSNVNAAAQDVVNKLDKLDIH